METTYTGFITGMSPRLQFLENKKDVSQWWLARNAKLTFKEKQLNLTLTWNGFDYTTISCQSSESGDYYSLKLHAHNGHRGWDDRAFL